MFAVSSLEWAVLQILRSKHLIFYRNGDAVTSPSSQVIRQRWCLEVRLQVWNLKLLNSKLHRLVHKQERWSIWHSLNSVFLDIILRTKFYCLRQWGKLLGVWFSKRPHYKRLVLSTFVIAHQISFLAAIKARIRRNFWRHRMNRVCEWCTKRITEKNQS